VSIAVAGDQGLAAVLGLGQSPSSAKPASNEKRNARIIFSDELSFD
jgi:hypothetical protein